MEQVHALLIFQLLMLIAVANGTPVAAKLVLGGAYDAPIDCDLRLADGYPLFGRSKTVRGVALSVMATALSAALFGFGWKLGAVVGLTAMAGDLLSSFIKRRCGWSSSSRATGLDHIPESLLPLLAAKLLLPLSFVDVLLATLLFFVGGIVLSRLLFRLNLRDEPY